MRKILKAVLLIVLSFGVFLGPLYAQEIIKLQKNRDLQIGNKQQQEKLGHYYYLNKQYDKAAEIFGELFRKTPNHYYYSYYLNSLLLSKNYEEAEALTRKQSKKNQKNYRYQVDYAYVLQQAGKNKKSEKILHRLTGRIPNNRSLVIQLANALQSKGYAKEALQVYEKATRMPHNKYSYNLERANAYRLTGDFDKMFDAYLNYLDHHPDNAQMIKNRMQSTLLYDVDNNLSSLLKKKLLARVQQHPENLSYNDLLLWLSVQTGDFTTALKQAKAIDKRFGGHEEEIYRLAKIAYSDKKYDIAAKAFEYLKNKGEESDYFDESYAGWLLTEITLVTDDSLPSPEKIEKLNEEGNQFVKRIGIDNQVVETFIKLASLKAYYLNKPDEAEALLQKVVSSPRIKPRQKAETKLALGDILLYEKKVWDASLLYSQVELDMKNEPLGHKAKFKNALLFYYEGEYDWAKARLDILKAATSKLIANDAMEMSMFIHDILEEDTLGFTLKQFGAADLMLAQHHPDSSLIWLDKIENNTPGPVTLQFVWFKKAKLFESEKKYETAVKYYMKLADTYPGSIKADDALFKAARIYESYLNNTKEAKNLYLRLMKNYPESVYSAEARQYYRKTDNHLQIPQDYGTP